ncbi:hypothetical protein DFJ74DRAFT_683102 [Hyaloraphidium curvatum]|nr:hypothetical protein DFJ74DRAFT_683102 [Hyaloraphidium curvatum]
MLARIAVSAAFTVCVAWTPMVTFAADFWTSGWAAAGALLVVSFVNAVVVSSIGRFGTNVAVLRLALRVQAPRRHLRPAPAARPASGRCAASPRGGGTLRPAPRRAADHLGEAVHRRADDLGRLPRRRRLFVLPRHRHQPGACVTRIPFLFLADDVRRSAAPASPPTSSSTSSAPSSSSSSTWSTSPPP